MKSNFPTLLSHRQKQFLEHHLSPEEKKQIVKKPVIVNEFTSDDNPLPEVEILRRAN